MVLLCFCSGLSRNIHMDSCDDNYDHSSWKIIHGDSFDKNSEYYDVTQQFLDTFQSLTLDTFHGLKSAVKRLSEVCLSRDISFDLRELDMFIQSKGQKDTATLIEDVSIWYTVMLATGVPYMFLVLQAVQSLCIFRLAYFQYRQSEFPCPSMINFTSVKGHFKVAKFDMIHNHAAPMPCPRLEIDPSVFPGKSIFFLH